jgi:LuxR family maltose regulon positive regulatory protein
LEQAEEHLLTGIELSRAGEIADDLRYSYLYLARLRRAQGDHEAALAAWRRADLILKGYNVRRLATLSEAYRARLELARGAVSAAAAWAEEYRAQRAARPVEYVRDVEDLTLARVLAAAGAADAALSVAGDVERTAAASGRRRTVMEAQLIQAIALRRAGRPAQAAEMLSRALLAAAPEGYLRLFLDEEEEVRPLLSPAAEDEPAFAARLRAAWREVPGEAPAEPEPRREPVPVPAVEMAAPLTEREEEVLRLLAAGLSNQEIADELTITLGTAKWHVHNVYQKLDVSSRTEAVARAHAWGLV